MDKNELKEQQRILKHKLKLSLTWIDRQVGFRWCVKRLMDYQQANDPVLFLASGICRTLLPSVGKPCDALFVMTLHRFIIYPQFAKHLITLRGDQFIDVDVNNLTGTWRMTFLHHEEQTPHQIELSPRNYPPTAFMTLFSLCTAVRITTREHCWGNMEALAFAAQKESQK